MPSPSIVPVAKTIYLCDGAIGFPDQKTDIIGLFNSIRPPQYPHVQQQFVIFAQLSGGLGQVPFYIDIRHAATGQLVHSTPARLLKFAHRDQVIQLSYTVHGCPFTQPGVYLVELLCNAQWVADTKVDLL
jgi:hypothetical protein